MTVTADLQIVSGTVERIETEALTKISRAISDKHAAWFHDRGIPIDWAIEEFNARSIYERSEFPERLQGYAQCGAGFRVDYQPIVGNGWSQIRLDTPPLGEERDGKPGKPKKYLGNSGETTGERFMLNRTMAARFAGGEYSRLIIVEGTGQYQVASYVYAEDERTLVVGVPGCWGWSDAGLATSEIYALCEGVKEVYVAFDADVDGANGNPKVHAAGLRLSDTVVAATGVEPRFLHLPASCDKAGFDDWAAASFRVVDEHGEPVVDRTRAHSATENLLNSKRATKVLSKTPPKGKTSEVELASGPSMICWDAADPHMWWRKGGAIERVTVNFALRIVASLATSDHLNGTESDLMHDVEIAIAGGGVRRVTDVRDADLHRIDALLARAKHAHGAWVGGSIAANHIVMVMKADAAQRGVGVGTAMPHTGLYLDEDGCAAWSTPSGLITAEGLRAHKGKAMFERGTNEASINFDVLAKASSERINEAWRAEFEVCGMFKDPSAHIIATAHQALAATGLPSEGGLYLYAPPGSGKTQFLRWTIARWGAGYRSHVLPGQSEANGSDIGQGLDGALVAMDDFKPFDSDPIARSKAVKILEMLARRAGDGVGEHSGRTGKRQVASGRWANGTADRAHPALVASGEEFPRELDRSSKQRMLTVEFPVKALRVGDGPDARDNYDVWRAISKKGLPNLAMGTYIQWICGEVDKALSKDDFVDALLDERGQYVAEIVQQFEIPKTDERVAVIAAGRLLGWALWCRAAQAWGAWSAEETEAMFRWGRGMVENAMMVHYRRFLCDVDESEDAGQALLDEVREFDLGHSILARSAEDRQGRFGFVGAYLPNGDLAINPNLLAKVLGREKHAITAALAVLSGMKGTRATWIPAQGKTARVYIVPKARLGTHEEAEAPAVADDF